MIGASLIDVRLGPGTHSRPFFPIGAEDRRMNGLNMLDDLVAFLVDVQPGMLSLFAAGLLVLGVMRRRAVSIPALQRSDEKRRERK